MIEVICDTRAPHRSHQWNEGNAVYDCSGVEPYPNGGSNRDSAALPFREPTFETERQQIAAMNDALQALSLHIERIQALMDKVLVEWTRTRDRLGEDALLADIEADR